MLNFFRRLQSQEDSSTSTNTAGGLIDLVDLNDFNIQVARVESSSPIDFQDVTKIVTDWMNDSYEYQLKSLGYLDLL